MTVGVDTVYTIISCYLPHPGLGFARFQSAIQTTRNFILSVPRQYRKHLMIGCDANCSLAASGPDDPLVGPNIFVNSNGPRAELLLDLLLEFSFCAVNTSGTDHVLNDPAHRSVEVILTSPSWTHEWYHDRSVRSIIDYVLAPSSLTCSCSVDSKLTCSTDHRPIVVTLTAARPAPRRYNRKP